MKKIVALLLTLVMMTTVALAYADTFRQGIDPEYPPFSYLDENGEYAGFDVEVCQAACKILGLDYEAVPVNWDNKENSLNANEHDCVWSGMTIKQSMIDAGFVISAPYYESWQVLVVRADSGIETSADLAGKVVAVQLGTSGQDLLEGDLTDLSSTFSALTTLSSFNLCFKELEGNAADAVFVDFPVAEKYVAEHPELKILDEKLGFEEYGICFRKDDTELCKKIEDAVAELVASGKYAEIAAEYPNIVDNLIFLKNAE